MRGSLISAPYLGFLLKNQAKIKIANVIMTDHHLGKAENAKFDHAHKISLKSQTLNLFDITATSIPVPRRLPTKEIFEKYVQENQFDRQIPIVFFDEHMHFSARAWFTFRYFGFKRVYVLDGGFHKWHHHHNLDKNESHVFEDLILQDKPKDEVTTLATKEVAVVSYLKQHNDPKADEWLILDARDTPRFKQGHIPGAYNVQFSEYLNDDYTMKSDDQLKEVYKKHGVDFNKKIINTCQTGKLSCIAILAQEILKKKQYDIILQGSYYMMDHMKSGNMNILKPNNDMCTYIYQIYITKANLDLVSTLQSYFTLKRFTLFSQKHIAYYFSTRLSANLFKAFQFSASAPSTIPTRTFSPIDLRYSFAFSNLQASKTLIFVYKEVSKLMNLTLIEQSSILTLPSQHIYDSSLAISPFYLSYRNGYSCMIICQVSLSSLSSTTITIGLGLILLTGGGDSCLLPFPLFSPSSILLLFMFSVLQHPQVVVPQPPPSVFSVLEV